MKKGDESNRQALNPKQSAFVDEYLVDLNATQAATRAGYSARTAGQQGHELLKKPEIQAAIEARRLKMQETTKITPEAVLRRWWDLASADPNELIQFRRLCCRHCYGDGHAFQWKDDAEYEAAVDDADREDRKPPSDEGGYGFKPTLGPHPECPKCFGEGHGNIHASDTRNLSPGARLLYDGVKQTKEGFEIKMQDRSKALESIAKHLGMFKLDVNHGLQVDNPLMSLMQHVAGKTLKPITEPEGE